MKTRNHLLVHVLLALVLVVVPPFAQAAGDVQVPLDRSGRVLRIDASFARRVGLFLDRPGLQDARLFVTADSTADSTYSLEIVEKRDGTLTRERIALTSVQADSLRGAVSAAIEANAPLAAVNQDGKPILVAATSVLAFGFWGWAVPYALSVDTGEAAVFTYMGTAAAGFFVPNALVGKSTITYGMGDMAWVGGSRGIVHGALAYGLIRGRDDGDDYNDDYDEGLVGTMAAVSMAECLGGYLWASHSKLDAGTANSIANFTDFGLLFGITVAEYGDNFDDDRYSTGSAIALVSSLAGTVAGRTLATHREYSYGDASVMRNTGWVGGMIGITLADFGEPDQDEIYLAGATIGNLAGLWLGDGLVRKTDITAGQSISNTLGTITGGLFGLGAASYFLRDNSSDDDSVVLLSATALSMVFGHAVTYRTLLKQAPAPSSWLKDVNISLSPQAALELVHPSSSRTHEAAPLLTMSCRF